MQSFLSPNLFPKIFALFLLITQLGPLAAQLTAAPLQLAGWLSNHPLQNKNWSALSLPQKRHLAPYLLEAVESGNEEAAKFLIPEQDPFLQSYAVLIQIYRRHPSAVIREKLLRRYAESSRSALKRRIFHFHSALAGLQRQKPLATLSDHQLTLYCSFAEQQDICRLGQLVKESGRLSESSQRQPWQQLKSLLASASFLLQHKRQPPFLLPIAAVLPDRLFTLGLPLEAALLAQQMVRAAEKTMAANSANALILRSRLPFYLAASADFATAASLLKNLQLPFYTDPAFPANTPLRNNRPINNRPIYNRPIHDWLIHDWLISGGYYRQALKELQTYPPRSRRESRFFSCKAPSCKELQIALLLYLSAQREKGLQKLQQLGESQKILHSEPTLKLLAQLRRAQLLLPQSPTAAYKIAENVGYLAQAKKQFSLEYRAVVIEGWALYFRGKYYRAIVNFVKAANIHRSIGNAKISPLSQQLGLFVARNRLNPKGNHNKLINLLTDKLQQQPDNRAIGLLKEWLPPETGSNLFLQQALQNLHTRQKYKEALELLNHYTNNPWRERKWNQKWNDPSQGQFFRRPPPNPGGLTAYGSSVAWSLDLLQSLQHYSAQNGAASSLASSPGTMTLPQLHPALQKHFLKKRRRQKLQLSRKHAYLFSFRRPEGYHVYHLTKGSLKAKGSLKRQVNHLLLSHVDAERLRKNCSYYRPSSCDKVATLLAPLSQKRIKKVERTKKAQRAKKSPKAPRIAAKTVPKILLVNYAPDLDLAYERLLYSDADKGTESRSTIEANSDTESRSAIEATWQTAPYPLPVYFALSGGNHFALQRPIKEWLDRPLGRHLERPAECDGLLEESAGRPLSFTEMVFGKRTSENRLQKTSLKRSRATGSARAANLQLWPLAVDKVKSDDADPPQPIYMRRFICGPTQVRLWDMERFSRAAAWLLIYQRRRTKRELDHLFAQHFARQGSALLEVEGSKPLKSLLRGMTEEGSLLLAFAKELTTESSRRQLRLILPSLHLSLNN